MKDKHFVIKFLFLAGWSSSVGMFLFLCLPKDLPSLWFVPWLLFAVGFSFYVFLELVWLALDYNKYLEQKEKKDETI